MAFGCGCAHRLFKGIEIRNQFDSNIETKTITHKRLEKKGEEFGLIWISHNNHEQQGELKDNVDQIT